MAGSYIFVGSTSGTQQGAFTNATSPKTKALATPTGAQVGDFLVAWTVFDQNGTNTAVPGGSGWVSKNQVAVGPYPASGTSIEHRCHYKFVGIGEESTSYTFTYTCTTGVMGPTKSFLLLYRGLDSGSLFDNLDTGTSFNSIVDVIPTQTISHALSKTTSANVIGARPLLLVSCYAASGDTVETFSSGDAALTARITDTEYHNIKFYDELWNSASDFPARTVTWTHPIGYHVSVVGRLNPTTDQFLPETSGDAWGWAN